MINEKLSGTQSISSNGLRLNYNECNDLVGMTKTEVMERLGLLYNDINCNVWMYHIRHRPSLLKVNYLYLIFAEKQVKQIALKVHRTSRFHKMYCSF